MEFAAREWLTVIIGLAILAVILDGIRRMRSAKRGSIKVSSNVQVGGNKADLERYGSELPSGGARVVAQRDEVLAEQLNREVKESYSASKTTKGYRIPEQVTLNLDESVPMLMDSVVEPEEKLKQKEPTLGDIDDLDTPENEPQLREEPEDILLSDTRSEPEEHDVEVVAKPQSQKTAEVSEPLEPELGEMEHQYEDPEEVLVINIMAPAGEYFPGAAILDACIEEGMRFGEMNIFHRHRDIEGREPIIFSMANIVMPGTFNIQEMDRFYTPGVSFFLALPCSGKSMDAFDLLYNTAKNLANHWGGELKDENRSVLTQQTVEHYRQRIRDFERKRLTHAH